MDPYELLESIDKKGKNLDDELYKKVYDEFCEKTKIQFNKKGFNTYGDIVRDIKDNYVYTSEYTDLFFDILKKYNYNLEHEITDAIFDIVYSKNSYEQNNTIKKYMFSPIIKDISIENKGKINIYSTFGDFEYILADYYFKGNKQIHNYLKTHQLRNRCHDNTYFLSKTLKDSYTIVSLCKAYFQGMYHHSYTYDKETGLIIDLCRKSLIKKDDFDKLYKPKEIIRLKNKNINNILEVVDRNLPYNDLCQILRIGLYYEINNKDKEKKYIK